MKTLKIHYYILNKCIKSVNIIWDDACRDTVHTHTHTLLYLFNIIYVI